MYVTVCTVLYIVRPSVFLVIDNFKILSRPMALKKIDMCALFSVLYVSMYKIIHLLPPEIATGYTPREKWVFTTHLY